MNRAQLALAIQQAAQDGFLHDALRDAAKAIYCDAEQEFHPIAKQTVTEFANTFSQTADAIEILSEIDIEM